MCSHRCSTLCPCQAIPPALKLPPRFRWHVGALSALSGYQQCSAYMPNTDSSALALGTATTRNRLMETLYDMWLSPHSLRLGPWEINIDKHANRNPVGHIRRLDSN